MWREDLVTRAHKIVAVERLHVDRPMRRVVDGVEEDLGAHGVRAPRHIGDIDEAAGGVRSHRAGHQPRTLGQERPEIGHMQSRAIAAHGRARGVLPREAGSRGLQLACGVDTRVPPDDARA